MQAQTALRAETDTERATRIARDRRTARLNAAHEQKILSRQPQTPAATEAPVTDPAVLAAKLTETEAALVTAETDLGKLEAAAEQAAEATRAARSTFEANPDEKLAARLMVAEQREKNARAAATAHAGRVVERLRFERDTIARAIEADTLAPSLEWSRVQEPVDRIRDAIVALARELDRSMPEVAGTLNYWHSTRERADGLGLSVHRVGLESLLARLRIEVADALGLTSAAQGPIDLVGTAYEHPTIRVHLERATRISRHLL